MATKRVSCAAGAFSLLIFHSPLLAQTPEEVALMPLEACASIQEDAERLACFDSALVKAKEIAIVERDKRRQRDREDFGLTVFDIARQDAALSGEDPDIAHQRQAQRDELEPDRINSILLRTEVDRRSGKRIFVLENGQTWQETSSSAMSRSPRIGGELTISKSNFGGFRLEMTGKKKQYPVRRIR